LLSRDVPQAVFVRALERALRYRIVQLQTLHRIAWLCLSVAGERPLEVEVDNSFRQRPAYQEGCLTDVPDLSAYDNLIDEQDPGGPDRADDSRPEPEKEDNHG
jgi:hypothetical protein